MNKIIALFNGKTGRFNYLLSIMIVVAYFNYIYTFCIYNGYDGCLVCNPAESIPLEDILYLMAFVALGGVYTCTLYLCMISAEEGCSPYVFIPLLLTTLFFVIQTIKRCHDLGCSGWRSLIPIYTSLFLLILPGKNKVEKDSIKTTVLKTLWNSKWLLLILLIICAAFYSENRKFIKMHHSFYSNEVHSEKQ